MGYAKHKRRLAILLSAALLFSQLEITGYAEGTQADNSGICEHHPEHTADCGYKEAEPGHPCGHEHTEDCYIDMIISDSDEEDEQIASDSDADYDYGLDRYVLDCPHERGEHDDNCGYIEGEMGSPCGYVCEDCRNNDNGVEGNAGGNTLPAQEVTELKNVRETDKTVIRITDFDALDTGVQNRLVPAGTEWEDLALPVTLRASGYPVTGDAEPQPEALTVEGVSWEIDPDNELNDGNDTYSPEIGSYCLTPVLPEGYELGSGAALPEIYVMIDGQVEKLYSTDRYFEADVNVINALIENGCLPKDTYVKDDPDTWNQNGIRWGAGWPQRVTLINNPKGLAGNVDVSGLKELERIRSYTTSARQLNVSGLEKLTEIELTANRLETINLSGVTNLESLYCQNNENLTELDVSDSPKLKHLWCSGNKLTRLDVSNTNLYNSDSSDALSIQNNPLAFVKLAEGVQLTIENTAGGTAKFGTYKHADKSVSLTSTPENGYKFARWESNDPQLNGSTANPVTFTLDRVITMKPIYRNPDAEDVAKAKALIEGASYTVTQKEAGTKEALPDVLAAQMNRLSGMSATGVTIREYRIDVSDFQPATAGDENNRDGTNGTFSFTVTFSKGNASDSASMSGTITANVYVEGDANYNGYYDGDEAVFNAIIDNNGLSAVKDDPAKWGNMVTWNSDVPKRITKLSLSGKGLAETLDVTGLAKLETLYCDDNKLVGLDITGLTSLKNVTCYDNPLTFFKISEDRQLIVGSAEGGTVQLYNYTHSSNYVTLKAIPDAGNVFRKWTATGTALWDDTASSVSFVLDKVITIKPEFSNPDAEAVAAAKSAIEGGSYAVEQADAETQDELKTALARQINNLLSGIKDNDITVTADDITVNDFHEAVEGNMANPDGTDGSFTFQVSLTKGSANTITGSKGGTITALELLMYQVTITAKKDGEDWPDSGKTYQLSTDGTTFLTDLAKVPNGQYDIYEGSTDTGADIKVEDADAKADVLYYTVTFYDGDTAYTKDDLKPRIVLKGGKTAEPDAPEKYGYTFTGWMTEREGGQAFPFGSPIQQTTGVYASWSQNTYAVNITAKKDGAEWNNSGKTFCLTADNGGTFLTNLSQVPDGTYKIYEGTNNPVDTGVSVTVDESAANAEINYYTVTFYDGDTAYTSDGLEPQIILSGKSASKPSDPSKSRYDFIKWVTAKDGNDEYGFGNVTDTTDVYASWKLITYPVTITPKKDGVKWENSGKTYRLSADGATFITDLEKVPMGLYDVYEGETDTGVDVDVADANAKADVLYYTVTFYDGDTAYTEGGLKPQVILNGKKPVKPSDPSKYGYTFTGWVTEKEGNKEFLFNSSIQQTTGVYASWSQNTYAVNITAKKDGAEWNNSGKTFCLTADNGGTFLTNLSQVPDGTYKIYEGTNNPVDTGVSVTVDENVANAEINYYTVTFYDGDTAYTSNGLEPQIILSGKSASKPSDPSKSRYDFIKWVTAKDGDDEYGFGEITDTTDVYASWELITYPVTITPKKDGMKWENSSKTYRLSADGATFITDLANVPIGLYDVYEGETNTGVEVDVADANAKVDVLYYTVTFYDGDTAYTEGGLKPQVILNGKKPVKPSDPSKSRYDFIKWVTAKDGDNEYGFGEVTDTTDVYASWELITYPVTITPKKDGVKWENSGKTYRLSADGTKFTTDLENVPIGQYDIYEENTKTGFSVDVVDGEATADVLYYTVEFSDGSTVYTDGKWKPQVILSGKTAAEPDSPAKEGYTFIKWVTENEGSSEFPFDSPIQRKTSVYASWILNYNPDDVAAFQALMESYPSSFTWLDQDDPDTWTGGIQPVITWSKDLPKQIIGLDFSYGLTEKLSGSLDVSGLENLVELNCSRNNLTGLILPGSLMKLNCEDNVLMELDVSGLNMTDLLCGANPLNSLILPGGKELKVLAGEGGTVLLDEIIYRPNGSTRIKLRAEPDNENGYFLKEWLDQDENVRGTDEAVEIVLTGIESVIPVFAKAVTIKVRKDGKEWTDHGRSYRITADEGITFITDLGAVPNGVYDIWEDNTDTGVKLTVDQTGDFAEINYYTAAFADGSVEYGSGPWAVQTVLSGKQVQAPTENPEKQGYRFLKWVTENGGTDEFSFENPVTQTTKIYAVFEEIPAAQYRGTVNGSYASDTGEGSYPAGETVTVRAGTRSGYRFAGWTSGNGVRFSDASKETTTFSMPEQDITVTADWDAIGSTSGGGGSSGGGASGGFSNSHIITTPSGSINSTEGGTAVLQTTVNWSTGIVVETAVRRDGGGRVVSANANIQATNPVVTSDDTETRIGVVVDNLSIMAASHDILDSWQEGNKFLITIELPGPAVTGQLKAADQKPVHVVLEIPSGVIGDSATPLTRINLPKEVLEASKESGKELTVTVKDEKGNVACQWMIDGTEMKKSEQPLDSMNLYFNAVPVKKLSENRKEIKTAVSGMTGISEIEVPGLNIALGGENVFPSKVKVKLPVGNEAGIYPGDLIGLYCYNHENGQIEGLERNDYMVGEDGYVTIDFDRGLDYVLVPKKIR